MYIPTEKEAIDIEKWLLHKVVCPQQRYDFMCRDKEIPRHPACKAAIEELSGRYSSQDPCPCHMFGADLCLTWARKVLERRKQNVPTN